MVNIVHASLKEPILKLMEGSTGLLLQCALLTFVGRVPKPTSLLQVIPLLDAVYASKAHHSAPRRTCQPYKSWETAADDCSAPMAWMCRSQYAWSFGLTPITMEWSQ